MKVAILQVEPAGTQWRVRFRCDAGEAVARWPAPPPPQSGEALFAEIDIDENRLACAPAPPSEQTPVIVVTADARIRICGQIERAYAWNVADVRVGDGLLCLDMINPPPPGTWVRIECDEIVMYDSRV